MAQIIYEDIEIIAFTKCGEEPKRTKINPNKRHSKNNTIIGWILYANGKYNHTFWKKPIVK